MDGAAAHRVIELTETGSTNKDAMRLALNGEPLPLWVRADRQTEGRGRAGRSWVSSPGNLHASLALNASAPTEMIPQVALLAGVALFDALQTLAGPDHLKGLRLKWPNDVMLGFAKIGGILLESLARPGGAGTVLVVGVGVNIVSAPDIGRPVSSLRAAGIGVTASKLLRTLADQFQTWLVAWDDGRNFAAIRQAWMARAGAIGEAITINTGSGPVSGTYQGLSDSGALIAEVGGRRDFITFGDVLLAADPGANAADG